MKRVLFVAVLALVVISIACAQEEGNAANRDFRMVYEGEPLDQPIDTVRLEKSAEAVLARYHWKVQSRENGTITARYERKYGGVIAIIEVAVSQEGYSIKYVSSEGLHVDLRRMKIHFNYLKWVGNLIKDIAVDYRNK